MILLNKERGAESWRAYFFLLCAVFYSIIAVTPLMQNTMSGKMTILSVAITSAGAFLYSNYLRIDQGRTLLFYFLVIIHIILYKAIGHSTCTWNFVFVYCITFLMFFLPPLFVSIKCHPYRIAKLFLFCFIIIVFVNVVDNVRLLILYPGASEAINFDFGEGYRSMNVGGSSFVYLVMFVGLFIMLAIQTQKKNHLLLWLLYLLSLVYILMSGRAIAVITYFVGSVLMLLYGNNAKRKRLFLYVVFILICIIVLSNMDSITQVLELYLESDRLSSRLEEAATLGQSDNSSGSGLGRIELYKMSLRTFLSSPGNFLFGVGDALSEGEKMYRKGIGMHSAFLDFAAKYGIIGLTFYYMLFRTAYLQTYKKVKKINPSCLIVFYIFIFSAFINNVVTPAILFVVFIIVPSYMLIINNKEQEYVTRKNIENRE